MSTVLCESLHRVYGPSFENLTRCHSETCEADVAYPPGWYPTATVNGTPVFSTFAQRFTGTLTDGSVYTVGDLATPSAPFSIPSSSSCATTSTISNGIALAQLGVTAAPTASASGSGPTSGSGTSGSGTARVTNSAGSGTSSGASSAASSSGSASQSSAAGSNAQVYPVVTLISLVSGIAAVAFFH
ncbi:hypothetical protein BDQ17DRAFT_551172 [Cyathus striatus]|nr:hypothetical protein BDQ17DRAFT_551172 [Cyathus striatus]